MYDVKENSLSRVNFTGGIIGLLAGSQYARIEAVIHRRNADRWNLAEVIPENRNLIIWVFRFVILILTLGLWTLSTGYILVFERPRAQGDADLRKSEQPKLGRREPTLSSGR